MKPIRTLAAVIAMSLMALAGRSLAAGKESEITVAEHPGSLEIRVGGNLFATYVYRDKQTLRPYFTNVRSPSGIQVTRHHPPRPGKDSTDHAELHPGVWLAFGDISGADFWRNRAKVEHVDFVCKPTVSAGKLTFTVQNRYVSGERTICSELCKHTLLVRPAGYLLRYDSTFRSDDDSFYFGDQEELGLGIRVASLLRVTGGNGWMIASDGKQNEKQVRGCTADWVDYSGLVGDHTVGLTLMPDPRNFRRCWYHARDYGFLTANPFGRNALTGGAKSKVIVKAGDPFRLRYGVLIHSAANRDNPIDLQAAYLDYIQISK